MFIDTERHSYANFGWHTFFFCWLVDLMVNLVGGRGVGCWEVEVVSRVCEKKNENKKNNQKSNQHRKAFQQRSHQQIADARNCLGFFGVSR